MFSKMKNYSDSMELGKAFTDAVYALYQADEHANADVKEKIGIFFQELKKVHNCNLEGINKQTYVFCHILQYISEEDEFYGCAKTNMSELLNPFIHLVKLFDLFCALSGGMAQKEEDIIPAKTYRKL